MSSAMSLANIIILIVVVPVVTIYMLLDWDNMIARIDACCRVITSTTFARLQVR